jgi:hypothetical protein
MALGSHTGPGGAGGSGGAGVAFFLQLEIANRKAQQTIVKGMALLIFFFISLHQIIFKNN